jgi:hypothetical protein
VEALAPAAKKFLEAEDKAAVVEEAKAVVAGLAGASFPFAFLLSFLLSFLLFGA